MAVLSLSVESDFPWDDHAENVSDWRGILITVNAHIKKTEQAPINNPTMDLGVQGKQEEPKPGVHTRKEVIKVRAGINEIEAKKIIKNQ